VGWPLMAEGMIFEGVNDEPSQPAVRRAFDSMKKNVASVRADKDLD